MEIIERFHSFHGRAKKRRAAIESFKAKINARRRWSDKFADLLTTKFGTVTFLVVNAIWFTLWIVWNAGSNAFDPFPYGLLTMVVSLEAIFLAIIVLISQNRQTFVAELREEIDLKINTITEEELTKTMRMLSLLLEKQGIKVSDDDELTNMLRPLSSEEIQKRIEEELE
ncbi:MAG: DUF1003 domain-containing protein [Patescibacteria group bacterium]